MGYGSTNGHGGGAGSLPGGGESPAGQQTSSSWWTNMNGRTVSPTTTIEKSVGYVASGSKSNQILAIAGTDSDLFTTADAPMAVAVHNTGNFPVVAMLGYEAYTDENTDNKTLFVHTLLLPGETIFPNMRGIISLQSDDPTQAVGGSNTLIEALALDDFSNATLWNLDGEVVDYTAPNTNLYTDSTAKTTEGFADDDDTTITFDDASGGVAHNMFKVNDLIRLDNEVCRIKSIVDTDGDGAYTPAHFIVDRAVHGTAKADHTNNTAIRLPFFNEYYDFDRVLSGNTQLVQTDAQGLFKSSNFFGYGRVATTASGLVPGSVCIRFYSKAYQDIPMGGTGVAGETGGSNISITSSTSSKLTAGDEYSFNLIIDDSLETTVSFTVDSSNVNFGGNTGVIRKIQDAIDTATRTAGNNLFGYSCSVGIVNGKLRFTSNSHLLPHDSTNGSKLEVKDGAGGTNVFTGAAGIFPDILNVIAPVKPRLPDLNVYDPITYATSPNMTNICYDNSRGRLAGAATGTISYETGKVSFIGPANASFEVSVVHNSPFSGKLDANKEDANTLTAIHANALNKNMISKIKVETFGG